MQKTFCAKHPQAAHDATGVHASTIMTTKGASLLASALIVAASTVFSAPQIALADGAFRWLDQTGRVHYGSNPPKDASNVVQLNGKTFSRYSASKMLKPYHNVLTATQSDAADAGESGASSTASRGSFKRTKNEGLRSIVGSPTDAEETYTAKGSKARLLTAKGSAGSVATSSAAARQPSSRASIREENIVSELSQGTLDVLHDDRRRITRCRVPFQNTSNIPAQGIIVSFEFPDGTLIPGVGPDSLSPGEEGTYAIPEEFLPVVVKNLADDAPPPKPQVSVKVGG